jgi:hypothetical protein
MLQFTAVLLEPVTVAPNVADCPPCSEAVDGVIEIATEGAGGTSEMLALADLVVFAALVAFTVMV